MRSTWVVERHHGDAGSLHALEPRPDVAPSLWVCTVDRPCLVLGSTQFDDVVLGDAAVRRGVEVARRRSGGAAVLLWPGEHLWLDIVVPSDHPAWRADVGHASVAIGEVWLDALTAIGVGSGSAVHRTGLVHDALGDLVCMAGRGPGEVLCGDAKLVGIAQRRTRTWARFQCIVHRRFRAALHAELLGEQVDPVGLGSRVACLDGDAPPDDALLDALVEALDGLARASSD